jgi:hypothetical protein
MRGSTVCQTHGGRAPQVKASAAQRIRDLAPTALDVIEALLSEPDAPGIRLAAARDLLDRAGFSPKQRIEHSGEVANGYRLTPEQRAAVAKAILGD